MSETQSVTFTYPFNVTAIADGSGYWGLREGAIVKFTKLELTINPEYGSTPNKWQDMLSVRIQHHLPEYDGLEVEGLCYSDAGIISAVREAIATHPSLKNVIKDISGSEQGMQSIDVFDCDSFTFYPVNDEFITNLHENVYYAI